jgi:hypothetical protein
MKKICFNVIILFLASCESKEPISINQIVSSEVVTLEDNYKDLSKIKDSVRISIPTEFEISVNSSNVSFISWTYVLDGKSLYYGVSDYQAYNRQNKTKPINHLSLNMLPNINPISIIVKERCHLISKKEAQALMKKYNVNSSLDHLQFGDTIKLIPFNKFIIENKALIKGFAEKEDSLNFRIVMKDQSLLYVNKKIDW